MNTVDQFRVLWAEEHQRTLAALQAIPADLMALVPHEGAMDLRRLALHIVLLGDQFIRGVIAGELRVGGSRHDVAEVQTPTELAAFCQDRFEALQPLVAGLTEELMDRPVPFLLPNGTPLRVAPGREYLFSALLAHLVHHRGQMLAALRAAGARIPGLYGPTREETPPMTQP
jgi:uncharacterized damage-inducible protein DinB